MHVTAVPSNLDVTIAIYFANHVAKLHIFTYVTISNHNNYIVIPMQSAIIASKISFNYARRNTPKAI